MAVSDADSERAVIGRFRGGRVVPVLIVSAFVAFVVYDTLHKRAENKRLRAAALPVCMTALADEAACLARIDRDHFECRKLATHYNGKGQGKILSAETYADCVTRGPAVLATERAATAAAAREAERRRNGALR